MTELLDHLESRRAAGRKLLVPYLMAGAPEASVFDAALDAAARYADAVEVGLPYSDPLMDGPVIASAGETALRNGTGPKAALDLLARAPKTDAPRVVMTYYNPVHRIGEAEFCRICVGAGAGGLIVPDLPLEESRTLREAAAAEGLAWIPLVAPTSPPDRVAALAASCTGFVYAVSSLGVTGLRTSLSERAAGVVVACREATDLPVLVGIGVSTAEQAVEASQQADGVVIGSAVVRTLAEEGVEATEGFLRGVRDALDRSVNG